jgi:hypothetical protein
MRISGILSDNRVGVSITLVSQIRLDYPVQAQILLKWAFSDAAYLFSLIMSLEAGICKCIIGC